MGLSPVTSQRAVPHDHRFHELVVSRVVVETADTKSFVLDVPPDLADAFAYAAGQFCTFRVSIDGEQCLRSYSMSSSPDVDDALAVTVKRVPGGVVSNWMNDVLVAGSVVETTCPAGVFRLESVAGRGDLIAFSAGSGITPVISLVKTALATTARRVRLLYANRDRDSVIFADELDDLVTRSSGRLKLINHLDVERGFVDGDAVRDMAGGASDPDFYVCGPAPFMEIVENTLLADDVEAGRIHIERFTPGEPAGLPAAEVPSSEPVRVTIDIDGRTGTTDHHAGTTILQTARQLGLPAPSSCEAGSCATCMARVVEGTAQMRVNNALTDEEVADGWVLTCQAVPTSTTIRVIYGFED